MLDELYKIRHLVAQLQYRSAQTQDGIQTVDPSRGGVHIGSQPLTVQTQGSQQLNEIRQNFMSKGFATPVRLQNGKTVIIAHGAPPQNGQKQWFIGPKASRFGSNNGWLTGDKAAQWAAAEGYPGAEFISCYNQGAFDNTGPLEIGVPTDNNSSSFTIKAD